MGNATEKLLETIKIVCAWCGEHYGDKEINRCEEFTGKDTHGICPECKLWFTRILEHPVESDARLEADVQRFANGADVHAVNQHLHVFVSIAEGWRDVTAGNQISQYRKWWEARQALRRFVAEKRMQSAMSGLRG